MQIPTHQNTKYTTTIQVQIHQCNVNSNVPIQIHWCNTNTQIQLHQYNANTYTLIQYKYKSTAMSGGVTRGKAVADTSRLNWLRLAQMGFAALFAAPNTNTYIQIQIQIQLT